MTPSMSKTMTLSDARSASSMSRPELAASPSGKQELLNLLVPSLSMLPALRCRLPGKRGRKMMDQDIVTDRLGQISERPVFRGTQTAKRIGGRSDDDNRHRRAERSELLQQLQTSHTRHVQIGDETVEF